jgi:hypothetical protein
MMHRDQLARILPLHVACVGEWRGTYMEVDDQGGILARYDSQLNCQLPDESTEYDFHQTNRYTHPDGRIEEYVLPGRVVDSRMRWDNQRMRGYAEELGDGRTILVKWVRLDLPGEEFFEMIQVNAEVTRRFRMWARYRQGILVGRTLINESRTA